jgi:hypothetical protein
MMCKRIRTRYKYGKKCTIKKIPCKIAARAHLHHKDKYKVRAIYIQAIEVIILEAIFANGVIKAA